jgi:hypothetical protein
MEIDKEYFRPAETSIPRLVALYLTFHRDRLEFDSGDYPEEPREESRVTIASAESHARYSVRKG